MPDLFNIGLAGLNNYQTAMNATSKNVTNVDNPDYGRRIADFGTDANGLSTVVISRAYDKYVTADWYRMTSTYNLNDAYADKIASYDQLVNNSGVDLKTGINNIFTALTGIESNPSLRANRQIMLNNMDALSQQFHTLYDQTISQISSNSVEVNSTVNEINTMVSSIANINAEIVKVGSDTLGLADERDAMLRKLTTFMNIDVNIAGDETATVRLRNGIPLVFGNNAIALQAQSNPENPIYLNVVSNDGADVTNAITGGSLGASLTYRSTVLESTLNGLGRLALSVQDQFNQQNKLGMDLNGSLGANIFTDINDTSVRQARVQANINNTGTATMDVSITDTDALTNSNYRLLFSSASPTPAYTLTRLSDSTVVASGTGALPASITTTDGFSINFTASAIAANDSYLIMPTRSGSQQINKAITNPDLLAMASPISTARSTTNTGTGTISPGYATDTTTTFFTTTAHQLSPPLRIVFTSPTLYNIVNDNVPTTVLASNIPFTPNQDNSVFPTPAPTSYNPGIDITLNGAPNTNDTFTIRYNTNGTNDGRNATQMSAIQDAKTMNGGTQTFDDAYATVIGDLATLGQAINSQRDSNKIVLDQLQKTRDAVSGVNLDEEAANLLQYQKVYQASAQIISMGNDMFKTLIGILGG